MTTELDMGSTVGFLLGYPDSVAETGPQEAQAGIGAARMRALANGDLSLGASGIL